MPNTCIFILPLIVYVRWWTIPSKQIIAPLAMLLIALSLHINFHRILFAAAVWGEFPPQPKSALRSRLNACCAFCCEEKFLPNCIQAWVVWVGEIFDHSTIQTREDHAWDHQNRLYTHTADCRCVCYSWRRTREWVICNASDLWWPNASSILGQAFFH